MGLILSGLPTSAQGLPAVSFSEALGSEVRAEEGWLTIDWVVENEGAAGMGSERDFDFELQQAASVGFADPVTRYLGRDGASFLSGLAEGVYFFRVRSTADEQSGAWSEPLRVQVDYGDRTRVWILLSAGTVAFFATVGTLVVSHRRSGREAMES